MDRPSPTRRGFLAATGSLLAAGAAGCQGLAPTQPTSEPAPTDRPDDGLPETPQLTTLSDDPGDDFEDGNQYTRVYRDVVDSVSAVRVRTASGTSQGTAWMYDDEHMVTNEHVVAGGQDFFVWFGETGWREARVVGTDVYSDLAVLRPRTHPDSATPLPLVSGEPPIGTRVVAIGNPFGLGGSVTSGIISGVNRSLPAANGFSIADAVQTDAAVNPGNSGGPLVTLEGRVVGVINSGGGDNIGFAISAALLERIVPVLVRGGDYRHSYMGIGLEDVTPPLVRANDLPFARGVYVGEVVAGTPSDGVLRGSTGTEFVNGTEVPVGGDVILGMGGTPIPTTQALSTYLALETSPGDTIPIEVYRDGGRQTVRLTLGQRPPP